MRARRASCLAAAVALLAGPAQAHCTAAADESAFDVGALKSELSVLAVACGEDEGYNGFVTRDRAELVREDGVVNAWFKKTYGKAAQSKYDSFITSQANEQSIAGQHEGNQFCPRLKPVFMEVAAVPVAQLPEYAAAKNLSPVDFACVTAAPVRATAPAHGARAARRKS